MVFMNVNVLVSVFQCETLHNIYHLFNFSVNCWSMLLEIIVNYSLQQSNCELKKRLDEYSFSSASRHLFYSEALCLFQALQSSLRHSSLLNGELQCIKQRVTQISQEKTQAHHVQKLCFFKLLYISLFSSVYKCHVTKKRTKNTFNVRMRHTHTSQYSSKNPVYAVRSNG